MFGLIVIISMYQMKDQGKDWSEKSKMFNQINWKKIKDINTYTLGENAPNTTGNANYSNGSVNPRRKNRRPKGGNNGPGPSKRSGKVKGKGVIKRLTNGSL